MFVEEILSEPAYVDGRRFKDRTIKSKFRRADISICTTYMDGKPILKRYIFEGETLIKHVWKTLKNGHVKEQLVDKNLNTVI